MLFLTLRNFKLKIFCIRSCAQVNDLFSKIFIFGNVSTKFLLWLDFHRLPWMLPSLLSADMSGGGRDDKFCVARPRPRPIAIWILIGFSPSRDQKNLLPPKSINCAVAVEKIWVIGVVSPTTFFSLNTWDSLNSGVPFEGLPAAVTEGTTTDLGLKSCNFSWRYRLRLLNGSYSNRANANVLNHGRNACRVQLQAENVRNCWEGICDMTASERKMDSLSVSAVLGSVVAERC